MKKISSLVTALWAIPFVYAHAGSGFVDSPDGGELSGALTNIDDGITNTLVPFVLVLAFLAFVWGVFLYFIAGGANEEKRETGKAFMIYAIAGFVLILILWGTVNFFANTLGFTDNTAVDAGALTP